MYKTSRSAFSYSRVDHGWLELDGVLNTVRSQAKDNTSSNRESVSLKNFDLELISLTRRF